MTLPLAGTLIGQYNLILSYLITWVDVCDAKFELLEYSSPPSYKNHPSCNEKGAL